MINYSKINWVHFINKIIFYQTLFTIDGWTSIYESSSSIKIGELTQNKKKILR